MANKDVVIGLEVHVQLKTNTKLFCGCSTDFGADPNANTCPVCMGLPGVLPVLNRRAVEFGMMAAKTLNCEINDRMKFDRKNYYYPDLPKAYQISQYDMPLAGEGVLELESNGKKQEVGVERVHLEEDAGKLIHSNIGNESYVDYNRTGTPLIEIVSKPDIDSPEIAEKYLRTLKQRMEYLGVSDCNMEEGSLRCDANLSIRNSDGSLGVKTEVKNMNSFKGVKKALEYEASRQRRRLQNGKQIVQGTRLWDEDAAKTRAMRTKEEAHDYRYFPDPDLVPVVIEEDWKKEIEEEIPEMPSVRRSRFIEEYNLPPDSAETLTATRPMADFYEQALAEDCDSETLANLMISDLRRELNDRNWNVEDVEITPAEFAELVNLLEADEISTNVASELLEELVETGGSPANIVEERDLKQISDEDALTGIITEVIEENPDAVEDIRGGTEQAIGYLVGQVMQKTQGQANPGRAKEMLKEEILG
ncbi:MAG: Asp-tRNA(Asn)/Glu-tRNA(Gln) amidotransferase subunit GatB [bacterium]